MKLLLDENLPRKIKSLFDDRFTVFTVRDMNWNGKKNGELLGLLTFNSFDGLITIDKNLAFQQNLSRFFIKIIILDAVDNRISTLQPYIEKLQAQLQENNIDDAQIINITI